MAGTDNTQQPKKVLTIEELFNRGMQTAKLTSTTNGHAVFNLDGDLFKDNLGDSGLDEELVNKVRDYTYNVANANVKILAHSALEAHSKDSSIKSAELSIGLGQGVKTESHWHHDKTFVTNFNGEKKESTRYGVTETRIISSDFAKQNKAVRDELAEAALKQLGK